MIAYSSVDDAAPPIEMDGYSCLSILQYIVFAPILLPWFSAVSLWLFSTVFVVLAPRACRWIGAKLKGHQIESLRLKQGVWTIHGRQYDLANFAKHHPGGAWALELGRNRDCTCLFESYHVLADMKKLEAMMAKYELPESKARDIKVLPTGNSTGLIFRDSFHEDVKQMARDYFKDGKSHKVKPWVFWLVICVIIAAAIGAVGMLYGYVIAFLVMPFLCGFLTFNVSHEASHFAFDKNPTVNSIFAFTSTPMFFNSTAWYIQHVVQHHVYTNDELDVDLYHFLPACRTSRFTKFTSTFRLQWVLVWLVLPTSIAHLTFVVPMDIMTRHVDPVLGTRRYQQCENIDDFVAGCTKWILLEFLISIVFSFAVMALNGVVKGFFLLSVCYSISSMYFIISTQGAHLQGQCMLSRDSEDYSWAKRQVLTSVNFSVDSIVWSFATGGLNMQALHHILPSISACHLREMFPKFREVCEKHGVELKEANGCCQFFGGFLSWVSKLSQQDANDDHLSKAKTS